MILILQLLELIQKYYGVKNIHPNYWDFEILSSTEIPEQLLIEILGSKENIIFVKEKVVVKMK